MIYIKPPILYRYLSREIFAPFTLALFVFTGILFLVRSLKLVDLVINKNVPLGDILKLFSYIIPRFLEIATPMALLLAIILAFGRLSADSELVVIRATGISLKQLAIPVLLFSSGALLLTGIITFWVRPWADHRLGIGMFEIARTQVSAGLIPGVFNDLGQLTIYAEKIEESGNNLSNIIISDHRSQAQARVFIARHGKIVSDMKNRLLNMQLYDGSIQEGSGQDFTVTYFEVTTVRLPHSEFLDDNTKRGGKKAGEMYIDELSQAINTMLQESPENEEERHRHARSLARYLVEFHKRLALPVSCLCISLIAMALGIQPSRGGHTWGAAVNVSMGITLILLYYVLFAFASTFAEQLKVPVALAMWAPNASFALLGFYLFERMGSEQWMAVSEAIGEKLAVILAKLRLMSPGGAG